MSLKQVVKVVLKDRLVKNPKTNQVEKKDQTIANVYDKSKPDKCIRFQPFIGVSIETSMDFPVNAVLSLGNPPPTLARNIINQEIEIFIGYENPFGNSGTRSIFNGIVSNNAYFEDKNGGSDVILHIPLIASGIFNVTTTTSGFKEVLIEAGTKIVDALNQLGVKKIEVSDEVKSRVASTSFRYNERINTQQDIINWLRDEGLFVSDRNGSLFIMANEVYYSNKGTNKSRSVSILNKKENTYPLINTGIINKYSVSNLGQVFSLDLAYCIPQLIKSPFITIPNVSTNINIFDSKSEDSVGSTFRILRQKVAFDTMGGNSHSLELLLNKPLEMNNNDRILYPNTIGVAEQSNATN